MDNSAKIKSIQAILGVTADGQFGKKSKAALSIASDAQERQIQVILDVPADGMFGRQSRAALVALTQGNVQPTVKLGTVWGSSFADPGDTKAFRRCKANDNSDKFCFGLGDNGIGYGGLDTTSTDKPMAALPKQVLIAKWGGMGLAHGRKIVVTYKDIRVEGIIGDVMSPGLKATIDLNPGFQTRFGVQPPFLIPVQWEWAESA